MPEGPEVRRYATELAQALIGRRIVEVRARTKDAKAWLQLNGSELEGRKILNVFARGKNVIGLIDGGHYFYSHQMMWGRWHVHPAAQEIIAESKERARIRTDRSIAILSSAPIFRIGRGDPFKQIEYLENLGPEAVVAPKQFDKAEFLRRLKAPANRKRFIGGILLDQSVVAGIGNYLRAEILFITRLNPWRTVGSLTERELEQLADEIPKTCFRAYRTGGFTVPPKLRDRMANDPSLVYVPGKPYGTRHFAFRRTNLPCLVCGQPIKQLRQAVFADHDEELTEEDLSRIVYFCAHCQKVDVAAVKETTRKRMA